MATAATLGAPPSGDSGIRSFRPRVWGQRAVTLVAAFVGLIVLSLFIVLLPTGFVVYSPGPSDVLVLDNTEESAIHVDGARVYPATGTLLWTSLTITARDKSVGLPEAVMAFLRSDWDVFPRELAYPVGRPVEQVAQEADDSLSLTRRNAIVAGLQAAGFPVSQAPIITYVSPTGPSNPRLVVGDLILAINEEPVHTAAEVSLAVAKNKVGDKVNIKVMSEGGTERDVTVTAVAGNTTENAVKLGISFADSYRYDPVLVSFNLGPHSTTTGGGLLLALGVYELLGQDDLLAGRKVAASGTVDASGNVSSVAGLTQKLISAQQDGADIFLVPFSSCSTTPTWSGKMRVVAVRNLDEAILALEQLRDDPQAEVLPC
jgi:PDZ domain-containing protein